MDANTRHNLKRNELENILIVSIEWIQKNRQAFYSILGITIGALIFSVFFFMRLHSSKARANDKFSMAQAQIYGGQIDAGLQSLDAIILQYRHTPASTQARMLKADYFISKKEFANAESVVRPAIDEGTPKSMMPLALMILGDIQESAGNYTAAIATYTTFIKRYADHFFVPKAYESLGRLYELNGSFTEAKAQYDKLSALYPGGGWAQRAQERIAIISASPLKSAAVQHGNNKQ